MSNLNTTPRKMKEPHQPKQFEWILTQCKPPEEPWIYTTIPTTDSNPLGDFPKNIRRWIWSSPGETSEQTWAFLAELEDSRFVFLTIWADRTWYEYETEYTLTIASRPEDLIQQAMDEHHYNRYLETTEPADIWV